MNAFQDQLKIKKSVDKSNFSLGLYFANYTQTNRWYFTEILTDVRDNPQFVDLTVNSTPVTSNGFRNYLSLYVNGEGQTTIFSGVFGAELQLSDQLRADLGARYEYNDFVQTSENTTTIDLDNNPATKYNNENFGNGSFRHFSRSLDDYALSGGLNYRLTDEWAIYGQVSRAYKMPALDEFLVAAAQEQVNLFKSRETLFYEGGIKFAGPRLGFMVNGFYGLLRNIVGQGAEVDTTTGAIHWVIRSSPDSRAYGAELEASATPVTGLTFLGAATLIQPQTVEAAGAALTAGG